MGEVFKRAAREALDARLCPLDVSEYRSAADAGVLAGPGRSGAGGEDAVAPGVGPEAAVRLAGEVKDTVSVAGRASYQLCGEQLTGVMGDLLQVGESAERAQVVVLADVITRGVVDGSDAGSPVQWLTDVAPCLEPGQASRVARIITDPVNACLRGVLVAGRVTVRGVQASVREARRVRVVLPDASWEQLLGYLPGVGGSLPDEHAAGLVEGDHRRVQG
ncbi:hypothetical protein [Leekyejoonella antrihumi]|uniref:hypothetical protein n=1 Tax=Leekyejoonella antrihumi TaxID=1660198 RepID=UPI0016454308|nr:hypothetical protein [Leekyejoonella antrihumi]